MSAAAVCAMPRRGPSRCAWLLLLVPTLTGCTMLAYPGAKRPDVEIAIVESDVQIYGFWGWSIRVAQVDGVDVGDFDSAVELLPGERTIAITYFSDVAGMMLRGRHPCFVTFEAVAGRRYQVSGEGSLVKSRWRGWLEDLTTGEKLDCVPAHARRDGARSGGDGVGDQPTDPLDDASPATAAPSS